jgi:hypothetical protein
MNDCLRAYEHILAYILAYEPYIPTYQTYILAYILAYAPLHTYIPALCRLLRGTIKGGRQCMVCGGGGGGGSVFTVWVSVYCVSQCLCGSVFVCVCVSVSLFVGVWFVSVLYVVSGISQNVCS